MKNACIVKEGRGVVQTKCDDHNVDTDVGTFWLTFSPRTKCCKNKYIGLGYAMLNTKYAQINISKGITQCVHREYRHCDSIQMWYRRVWSVSMAIMYSSCLLVATTKSSHLHNPIKDKRWSMNKACMYNLVPITSVHSLYMQRNLVL